MKRNELEFLIAASGFSQEARIALNVESRRLRMKYSEIWAKELDRILSSGGKGANGLAAKIFLASDLSDGGGGDCVPVPVGVRARHHKTERAGLIRQSKKTTP